MRGVDYVFHAGSAEASPFHVNFTQWKQWRTNVLGTENVLEWSQLQQGVKRVVCLSTDIGGCTPINVMGNQQGFDGKSDGGSKS